MTTSYQRLTLLAQPVVAAAALGANLFVTGGGALPAAGGDTFGITQFAAASGDTVSATMLGIETLLLSGTVAAGGLIEAAADGSGVPNTTGKVRARALLGGGAGDYIPVFLIG